MAGVSLKSEEEALYTNNGKSKQWCAHEDRNHSWHTDGESNKDGDKKNNFHWKGSFHQGRALKNCDNSRRFEGRCHNYGKSGHMKKYCWFKKPTENNATISSWCWNAPSLNKEEGVVQKRGSSLEKQNLIANDVKGRSFKRKILDLYGAKKA